ncbi:MAG: hypothetical protein ACTIC1_19955, partial [Brevibacterium sp.]
RVARTMTTIVAIPAMSARMSCRSMSSSAVRPDRWANRGVGGAVVVAVLVRSDHESIAADERKMNSMSKYYP